MDTLPVKYDQCEFTAAYQRIKRVLKYPSPLKYSSWLSQEIGADVFIKFECFNESSSFKLRGVLHYLLSFHDQWGKYPTNVITASGGNHGQAVAVACKKLGIRCTVVLPGKSATEKRLKVLQGYWKAEVIVHGDCFQEANELALSLEKQSREGSLNESVQSAPETIYLHPYNHQWVVQGQSTIAFEIFEQLDGHLPEIVISSIGGGGLSTGLILGFQAVIDKEAQYTLLSSPSPITDLMSFALVETEGADWFYQSWRAGHRVTLPLITSIALTLGASTSSHEIYSILSSVCPDSPTLIPPSLRDHKEDNQSIDEKDKGRENNVGEEKEDPIIKRPSKIEPICVTDRSSVEAICQFLENENILLEPATSCNVAAMFSHKHLFRGKKVVLVVCGMNATLDQLITWKKDFGISFSH